MNTLTERLSLWLGALCAALLLCGCGGYQLQGRVIESNRSAVLVVPADDARLAEEGGIGAASVEFTLDPRSLGRKNIGGDVTGLDGAFGMSPNVPGAGLLKYELGVVCRRRGYNSAVGTVPMPGRNKRLLIMLAPGADTYQKPEDLIEDSRRFLSP